MSEQIKWHGIGYAFLCVIFMLVGVPIISMMLIVGPEDYFSSYCKQTPLLPCLGMTQ